MRRKMTLFCLMIVALALLAPLTAGCGGGGETSSGTNVSGNAPAVESTEQTTGADGRVDLTSQVADVTLPVIVQDESGNPVQGVTVRMYSDADQLVVHGFAPGGGVGSFLQSLEVASLRANASEETQELAVLPALLIVVYAVGVVDSIREFVTDPPTAPVLDLGGPGVKVCTRGDVNDVLAVLGLIPGASLGGAARHVAFRFGAGQVAQQSLELVIDSLALHPDVKARMDAIMGDQELSFCYNPLLPFYVEVTMPDDSPILDPGAGTVSVSVTATGQIAGHVADLSASNLTSAERRLLVFPGLSFINRTSADRQDVTTVGAVAQVIGPFQTVFLPLEGACINHEKAAPEPGDQFEPVAEPRADLTALGRAMDRLQPPPDVAQAAVWALTDDVPPNSEVLARVRQLFVAAGLDPDAYPALTGGGAPRQASSKAGLLR